jgi:hypothetical protein
VTRTEDRLADALAARANAVRPESLRPLQTGSAKAEPKGARARHDGRFAGRTAPAGSTRWARKLVPLSAALAFAAVVGLIAFFGPTGTVPVPEGPFADVGSAKAPPPYVVDMEWGNTLVVRATATGTVADSLRPPHRWNDSYSWLSTAVAASPEGRTFVAVYNMSQPDRTGVYQFTLTRAGRIIGFRLVRGGDIAGLAGISVAVSPDGSKVAIAGVPQAAADGQQPETRLPAGRLVVINLRTGQHSYFAGGMTRKGQQFAINDVSWAHGGRSLVYLAQWCRELQTGLNAACRGATEVRELAASAAGGTLAGGRILLRDSRTFPQIVQAVISPNGQSIVALTIRRKTVSVAQFGASDGKLRRILYQGRAVQNPGGGFFGAYLATDGSGRNLIVNEDLGLLDAWLRNGRLHPLKTSGSSIWSLAW